MDRKTSKGSVTDMNQDTADVQTETFAEYHPWLMPVPDQEEDSVEEVIRYTLDEIRFA